MMILTQDKDLTDQIARAEEWRTQLEEWVEALRAVSQSHTRLQEVGARLYPGLLSELTGGFPNQHIQTPLEEPKTNVDVFETILREQGRPLHIRELACLAEGRVTLGGLSSTPTETKIRNSLSGAPHRFCNVGGNIWWLAGLPVPDARIPAEGSAP